MLAMRENFLLIGADGAHQAVDIAGELVDIEAAADRIGADGARASTSSTGSSPAC